MLKNTSIIFSRHEEGEDTQVDGKVDIGLTPAAPQRAGAKFKMAFTPAWTSARHFLGGCRRYRDDRNPDLLPTDDLTSCSTGAPRSLRSSSGAPRAVESRKL
jgi:hypothetical protein